MHDILNIKASSEPAENDFNGPNCLLNSYQLDILTFANKWSKTKNFELGKP